MSNEDGSVWIVFNGEIYNFGSYDKISKAVISFVPVPIPRYCSISTKNTARRCSTGWTACLRLPSGIGQKTDCFWLAIPLDQTDLCSTNQERVVFGSELKPLLASGQVSRELDRGALNDFFDFHWIPALVRSIAKFGKFDRASFGSLICDHGNVESNVMQPAYRPKAGLSWKHGLTQSMGQLFKSVQSQLVSDEPVGAFLSGGIDSTLVSTAAPGFESRLICEHLLSILPRKNFLSGSTLSMWRSLLR